MKINQVHHFHLWHIISFASEPFITFFVSHDVTLHSFAWVQKKTKEKSKIKNKNKNKEKEKKRKLSPLFTTLTNILETHCQVLLWSIQDSLQYKTT